MSAYKTSRRPAVSQFFAVRQGLDDWLSTQDFDWFLNLGIGT